MSVGPVTQQGIISTAVSAVQNDRPTAVEPQRVAETPPPPPPPETGRGATVDTSA